MTQDHLKPVLPMFKDYHAHNENKRKFIAAVLLFLCIAVIVPIVFMITAADVILPPRNDQCVDAYTLKVDGKPRRGTFQGSSADYGGAFCGSQQTNDAELLSAQHRLVVWYKFRGTGKAVRIRRTNANHNNNHNVSVAVYRGDDACHSLVGVKTNATFGKAQDWIECNSPDAPISTIYNQTYFIYVASSQQQPLDQFHKNSFASPDFAIGIESVTTVPLHNWCDNALAIPTDGSVIPGSLQDTTWSAVLSDYDYFGSGSFGVWYAVSGRNNSNNNMDEFLKVTLQDFVDTVRLRMPMFTGSCKSLQFVTALAEIPNQDDDGAVNSSSFSTATATSTFWECSPQQDCQFIRTQQGEDYLVYVFTKDTFKYTLPDDASGSLSFEISAQFL